MNQIEPERFQFTSGDGLSITCVKWSGPHQVRGVVQIAHGLGEHMGRYTALAETLVQGEFVVYGSDHRGHGLIANVLEALATSEPAVLISSWNIWFLLELSRSASTQASHTFCLATVWVLSPRSNLSSTIVIQSMAWRFPGPAFWTAWLASVSRHRQERIR